MTKGSHFWQLIFFSFALVLILFEIVRGWRLGLVRQIVRLIAVLAAYAAGLFGGRILLPILRPVFRAPDLVLAIVSGAVLALIVYALIAGLGAMLFKKTAEQRIGFVRVFYGATGALLGIFFGLLTVWLIVVGVRSLGAVASAEVHRERKSPEEVVRPNDNAPPLVASLAKLKNSLELGSLGEVVKKADVVPATTYSTLGKLGAVVSDPRSAERFLAFPGSEKLAQSPKIVALRDDPEISELVREGRFVELLQNPKLIAAMNDPELAKAIHQFDLQKALDYALRK